ncbi:hypothetical protein FGKAn22_18920 [Ferrigenium kumadai]|uniref:Uncharacterized protein n=1 Tax=Ferrigenium kumadai TaxID=1682490 RepID=A0AAN1T1Y6_9PROT|nr:hypothetical protein [Ferrigenium kumadai]BBJ00200.1 hypothetical protein FGKAn22_18920 [Ferrigenium kumadai]
MRFTPSDFQLIRSSVLAIFAAIFASAVVLYSSARYAEQTRKDHHDALQQLNAARSQLNGALEDKENMAAYADEYATLADFGIIGEDRRLDWVEGLENIRQQNLVTDFRYNIAPQIPYAPQPPIASGDFDIRYSEMKLQFDLLHEGQLLDFFTALRSQIKGWYLLEGCTMQRTAASDGNPAIHLTAECNGGWITLKKRNEAP